jgi:hypothetical protein
LSSPSKCCPGSLNAIIDSLRSTTSSSATQPISRKSEQICNRSVKTCCQQADIRMRSPLALYLSVLTGPQRPVNRSVTSCCDRAAECCFQQAYRKLLWQSCSNAVFNRPVASCWHRTATMLFSTTCDRPVANRGKRLMKLVYPLFWTKKGQTGCHISVVVFREIARLSYKHL